MNPFRLLDKCKTSSEDMSVYAKEEPGGDTVLAEYLFQVIIGWSMKEMGRVKR